MPTKYYQFYARESEVPCRVRYTFKEPFYLNLEEQLRQEYGSELTYLKLIDHERQLIKEHSAYDSGKGCIIVHRKTKTTISVLESFFKDSSKTKIVFYPKRFSKRKPLTILKLPVLSIRYDDELLLNENIVINEKSLKIIADSIKSLVVDTSCFEIS